MEEMGAMAVKPHELIAERTHSMEDAIYAALDAIDAYGAMAARDRFGHSIDAPRLVN